MLEVTQKENHRKAKAKETENQRKAELERETFKRKVRTRNVAKRGRNQEKRYKCCNW